MIQNSNEDELKRRLRSVKGKIKRRDATIVELKNDRFRLSQERRSIEMQLESYRAALTPSQPEPTEGEGR